MKPLIVLQMLNNFSKEYRVYYEDTDAGGVVYYANYLKFFERARTDFVRSLNISQGKIIAEHNLAFVVKSCKVDFIKPAKLDDLILVSVNIKNVGIASIGFYQEIFCDSKIVSKAEIEIVLVDLKSFKPKKIEKSLRDILENKS